MTITLIFSLKSQIKSQATKFPLTKVSLQWARQSSVDGNQKVGFASDDAAINAGSRKENLILAGGSYSTLTSGAGNDTIFAKSGSRVDAGAGKNYIEIEERGASDDGVAIAMSEGKNTIANFNAGFEDTSDRLFFGVNDRVDFKFDGSNVSVQANNTWRGILADIENGADFVNLLAADKNSTQKVVVAQ